MPARSRGFTLLEVAIAIAVVAILAGTAIPLVLKSVNQAKEQRARQELKQLYEGMFGAPDRQVPNLRADMAFPPAGVPNLAQLTQALGARAYGAYAAQPALFGGWRGPYWNGNSNAGGVPMDPWNRAYQIRNVAGAWQVYSLGPNGVLNLIAGNPAAQGDDVVYPASTPLPTLSGCTLSVTLRRVGNLVPAGALTATAAYPSRVAAPTNLLLTQTPPGSGVFVSAAGALPSGPVVLTASIPNNVPTGQVAQTQTYLAQAPSGGTLIVNLTFN
jgi:general secretion pathway protein G